MPYDDDDDEEDDMDDACLSSRLRSIIFCLSDGEMRLTSVDIRCFNLLSLLSGSAATACEKLLYATRSLPLSLSVM